MWDKDGNKVIDLGGGFGPVLYGHNAPFVREAICNMMMDGKWGLGFEHEVAGAKLHLNLFTLTASVRGGNRGVSE